MKMKSEKGILTVEATLILTTLIFFITFILSFGRVYMAQYYVTHSMIQTSRALAYKSYKYNTYDGSVIGWVNDVLVCQDDLLISRKWEKGEYEAALKDTYKIVISNGENHLKSYGLEKGLGSITFEEVKKDGNDLVIKMSYKVRLPFGFFGHEYATLHQDIKTGLWGH